MWTMDQLLAGPTRERSHHGTPLGHQAGDTVPREDTHTFAPAALLSSRAWRKVGSGWSGVLQLRLLPGRASLREPP